MGLSVSARLCLLGTRESSRQYATNSWNGTRDAHKNRMASSVAPLGTCPDLSGSGEAGTTRGAVEFLVGIHHCGATPVFGTFFLILFLWVAERIKDVEGRGE